MPVCDVRLPSTMRSGLCLIVCVLLLSGCSQEGAKRFVYDLGNQYQCNQDASGLPDASARKLECTSPSQNGRPSYDQYRQQTATPSAH